MYPAEITSIPGFSLRYLTKTFLPQTSKMLVPGASVVAGFSIGQGDPVAELGFELTVATLGTMTSLPHSLGGSSPSASRSAWVYLMRSRIFESRFITLATAFGIRI